jgi:signal transduction histidine kinase
MPGFLKSGFPSAYGQRGISAAVLALLGLVVWLAWEARASDRSRRAAAEGVLRDYGSFAAWEFERSARGYLSTHLAWSIGAARKERLVPGAPLPPPSILSDSVARCRCGFQDEVRFAFVVDLSTGAVRVDRPVEPALHDALGRFVRVAEEFTPGADSSLRRMPEDAPPSGALRFDTLNNTPYVVAFTVLRDRPGPARALYGLAADPRHFADDFARIVRTRPLLPPSLVGGGPNDSVMWIRVSHPDVGTVYTTDTSWTEGSIAATDTLERSLGGLIVTVAPRREVAQSLLIGGVPATRLPLYLGLLALAVALTLLAMVQLRKARELERLQARFVANVSHEIRTPLAQISMFSETLMLERDRAPEERRHFLSVIFRESKRLSHLVESVLRFSRAEAGTQQLMREALDLTAEVREVVEGFAPLAAAGDVRIEVGMDGPASARVDSGAFRQILLNLLDNAMKYGPRGQTVMVRVERLHDEVLVSVEDQGPGIPPGDREKVFEPFIRLERAEESRVSGAGIGLSVVRELASAHGGRVWVEGANGGARVVFTVRGV